METKKCPYCGGEILAEAKKCKFCKEWLPTGQTQQEVTCEVCGESNPMGTVTCTHCGEPIVSAEPIPTPTPAKETADSKCELLKKEGLFQRVFPLAIAMLATILFIGAYANGEYCILSMSDEMEYCFYGYVGDTSNLMPWIALAMTVLIIWVGVIYSGKFTDKTKSRAAIRAWFALGVYYLWWPVSMIFGWCLAKTEIISMSGTDYLTWLKASMWGVSILAIASWLYLKFNSQITFDKIIKLFVISSTIGVALMAIATVMQFGFTSYLPGVHL